MANFKGLVLVVAMVSAQALWAVAPPVKSTALNETLNPYKCRIGVIHPALPQGFTEFLFTVPERGEETHGGAPMEFKTANQTVTVLANGQWLAISWRIEEKTIAEVVTVIGAPTREPRALIAYDPADPENNQVALDCRFEIQR